MATKNNPGEYDCYTHADGDEPIFTLRANDPIASLTIQFWIGCRRIYYSFFDQLTTTPYEEEAKKWKEAKKVALEMEVWRIRNKKQMVGAPPIRMEWKSMDDRSKDMHSSFIAKINNFIFGKREHKEDK